MYEKDGRRYFIVDGHTHFWDARPENRNRYGEGFIDMQSELGTISDDQKAKILGLNAAALYAIEVPEEIAA